MITTIESRLERLHALVGPEPETAELRRRMAEVARLVERMREDREPGGSAAHPLGHAPFAAIDALYQLDRCEVLLEKTTAPESPQAAAEAASDRLVYPSLGKTAFRRFIATLLYVRGRLFRRAVNYDPPTLREMLYLKCPVWLGPFFWLLLPRKRPRWSYAPKRSRRYGDASDHRQP